MTKNLLPPGFKDDISEQANKNQLQEQEKTKPTAEIKKEESKKEAPKLDIKKKEELKTKKK